MEWRTQSRRVTLTSCMDEMRDKHTDNLSHAMWCAMIEYDDANTTRTNKKTTCTFTCQVSRFMCFMLILVFTLSLVSDVSSFGSTTHCSPTLSCHRQLRLWPQFLHVAHRENGSFEVLFTLSGSHRGRRHPGAGYGQGDPVGALSSNKNA